MAWQDIDPFGVETLRKGQNPKDALHRLSYLSLNSTELLIEATDNNWLPNLILLEFQDWTINVSRMSRYELREHLPNPN